MKAARHATKRNQMNSANATRVRKTVKAARKAVEEGNQAEVKTALPFMVEMLDRMSRRGVVHPNKAARLKSRITRQANQVQKSPTA